MLTHCGVESVKFNGGWWNAVTPLYGPSGEGAGPPAGWNEPWQEGTLTLEAEDQAVFVAVGKRVMLQPSATDDPFASADRRAVRPGPRESAASGTARARQPALASAR